jgi:hypothetical protein
MHSFQAAFAVALVAFTLAAAQYTSSSSTPTTTSGTVGSTPFVNLFINDAYNGDTGYAVSIVSACADETVYAIKCTSGPATADASACGPNAEVSYLILLCVEMVYASFLS